MKHKLVLLYAWFVRSLLFFLPDVPLLMRFRGFMYGLAMKKCGRNFQVAHSTIINGIDLCSIGKDVYIANGCSLILNGTLTIGDDVIFGPGVLVSSGDHQFDGKSFRHSESKKQDVSIGECSWIGGNSSILGNSVIPVKTIIAAGSVVTKNCCKDGPGIYGGVPAKFIKQLK